MNEITDEERGKLEELLRNISLADASLRLDERMERMLSPYSQRWIGPLCGFAAGVLATLGMVRGLTVVPRTPMPPVQPTAQALTPRLASVPDFWSSKRLLASAQQGEHRDDESALRWSLIESQIRGAK